MKNNKIQYYKNEIMKKKYNFKRIKFPINLQMIDTDVLKHSE